MSGRYHDPVLLEETLEFLLTDRDGTYVDGTLGGGGHAAAIARALGPRGMLIGVDRDPEALRACAALEAEFSGRVRLRRGDYAALREVLAAEGIDRVRGVLLDLGVSSHQLDAGARGFSFLREGPLDMRMDPAGTVTAEDLVNGLDERELARLFLEFGEEPRADRVARFVAEARKRKPLRTTADLARVVERALGRRGGKHPGTRVFQALRIAVNGELDSLDRILRDLPEILETGGRAVVIAYHSLEDRRVKQAFVKHGVRCPGDGHRCNCGAPGRLRALTRKVVKPARSEVTANPRARSARLRAAELLDDSPSGASDRGGLP